MSDVIGWWMPKRYPSAGPAYIPDWSRIRLEWLDYAGIPEALRTNVWVTVRENGPFSPEKVSRAVFVIGRGYPERTLDDLLLAGELGLELSISRPAGFDLMELAPGLSTASRLQVFVEGGVGILHGWRALRHATRLEQLECFGLSEPLRIENLAHLRSVRALGPFGAYACLNPNLRELMLAEPDRWPEGLVIEAPLDYIGLSEMRDFSELPKSTQLGTTLKASKLLEPRRFNTGSLEGMQALEDLVIFRCRRLDNFDTLADLRSLRTLDVSGVESMPGSTRFAELGGEYLHFEQQSVISRAQADAIKALPGKSHWHISPPKVSGDDRARARFLFHTPEGEEVDSITLAPFQLWDRTEDGTVPYTLAVPREALDQVSTSRPVSAEDVAALLEAEAASLPEPWCSSVENAWIDDNEGTINLPSESLVALEKAAKRILKYWNNPAALARAITKATA